ncbi:981_t:CDS:2 [Acaulospora morrowiae]|uniref:981_t:CDS:1 n=1 Tax=Acaulospora morrowiae TaxID=94023 RepID=A0A9N8VAQ9_9GLOM|nr:981_t:CDS:2 [Acaulospora morrowiae]
MTKRYNEHKSGEERAAMWTRKYQPISIKWTRMTNNGSLELAKTLEYMKIYGIENVRGACYSKVDLHEEDYQSIHHDLLHICFRCGEDRHWAHECNKCSKCNSTASSAATIVADPVIILKIVIIAMNVTNMVTIQRIAIRGGCKLALRENQSVV